MVATVLIIVAIDLFYFGLFWKLLTIVANVLTIVVFRCFLQDEHKNNIKRYFIYFVLIYICDLKNSDKFSLPY
jgi:hypothetical protein